MKIIKSKDVYICNLFIYFTVEYYCNIDHIAITFYIELYNERIVFWWLRVNILRVYLILKYLFSKVVKFILYQ